MIGNLLSTRKWEVVFVAPGRPDKWIRIPSVAATTTKGTAVTTGHKRTASEMEKPKDGSGIPADRPMDPALLPEGDPDVEIESLIIPALEELHTSHIREASEKNSKNGSN